MCSYYQTLKDAELLLKKFDVTRPGVLGKYDMWPRIKASSSAARPNMTPATRRYRAWKSSPAVGA